MTKPNSAKRHIGMNCAGSLLLDQRIPSDPSRGKRERQQCFAPALVPFDIPSADIRHEIMSYTTFGQMFRIITAAKATGQ